MKRGIAAILATVVLFFLVQVGALALVQPFMDAGYQAVEDPTDPTNSLLYIVAIIIATLFMLIALRYGVDRLIQALVILAAVVISFYVFSVLFPDVARVGSLNVVAVLAAIGVGVGLLAYPEWFVIDTAGIILGAGAAGLFGISFGVLPALLLLSILAVYDAISVYGTEHMLTLASGVMDLQLPVVLVVPLTLSYSYRDAPDPQAHPDTDTPPDPTRTEPHEAADTPASDSDSTANPTPTSTGKPATQDTPDEAHTSHGEAGDHDDGDTAASTPDGPFDRDAFYIGLGDAVIPTILIASAAFFRPGGSPLLDVPGIALTIPALGAMLGTICGLLVLMWLVMKGRAHAGLPLLNGGAIAGYLIAASLTGITLIDALGLSPYL